MKKWTVQILFVLAALALIYYFVIPLFMPRSVDDPQLAGLALEYARKNLGPDDFGLDKVQKFYIMRVNIHKITILDGTERKARINILSSYVPSEGRNAGQTQKMWKVFNFRVESKDTGELVLHRE